MAESPNQPAPSDTPIDLPEDFGKAPFDCPNLDNAFLWAENQMLKKEVSRLSAEREKERTADVEQHIQNVKAIERLATDNGELRATLAERDRQLAEVWKLLGIRNGAYDPGIADGGKPGFTANGTDFHGTAIQCLEATIDDSQRQKAELEGKVEKVLEFLTEAEREIMGARFAIQSLRQSTQTEEKK